MVLIQAHLLLSVLYFLLNFLIILYFSSMNQGACLTNFSYFKIHLFLLIFKKEFSKSVFSSLKPHFSIFIKIPFQLIILLLLFIQLFSHLQQIIIFFTFQLLLVLDLMFYKLNQISSLHQLLFTVQDQ